MIPLPLAPSDAELASSQTSLLTMLVGGLAIVLLLRFLRRRRPGLTIFWPMAVGYSARIIVAGGLSLTGGAATLRGGDEETFLFRARELVGLPLQAAEWTDAAVSNLHILTFALQLRFLESPDLALRTTEAALAICGLALMTAGVYDLAGERAARVAAWLLALEPAGVFFAGVLHKEPLMLLAEGLVVYGGARVWKDGRLTAVTPMALGCLIAVATRPYAGWFLIAASAAIILHASFRVAQERSLNAVGLAMLIAVIGIASGPTVLSATEDEDLALLQQSQEANVENEEANLSLEAVDYSTRGAVVSNLPQRMRDVLLRPYPWQVGNTSQQLGVAGTMVFLTALVLLAMTLAEQRTRVMARGGPLVYTAMFMLVAYSLSAGNAGTAFRYRTHIIALTLCLIAAVRVRQQDEAPAAETADDAESVAPAPRQGIGRRVTA